MRFICLALLLLLPRLAVASEATLAWFSDASISDSVRLVKPALALPTAPGTTLSGVSLTKAEATTVTLPQSHGMISFWIKPNWDGNDGKQHKIIYAGNPAVNGFIVEKSTQNTLRFAMAAAGTTVSSRTDVSNWKSGQWHHVAVSWVDQSGKPLGICLWIDKVCFDSAIWSGSSFINQATMTDKKVYVGDPSSEADMDELIFHNQLSSGYYVQIKKIYSDYFSTVPYTAIKVDYEPGIVRADKRVVKGFKKQFGLFGELDGQWVRLTDFVANYSNWGDFDAKPLINWTTSNTNIAAVDNSPASARRGCVTGVAIGNCTLTATFRGMTANYAINVISPEQPDVNLMFVERTPRYAKQAAKKWPSEGETVQSIAHVGNFGFTTLAAGTVVKFERITDTNDNWICDDADTVIDTRTATISALAPMETTTVSFAWNWTMAHTFIRVTVDPDDAISEICEANNQNAI